MYKKIPLSAVFLCIFLLLASNISAQTFRNETYTLVGTGSFMDELPVFRGDITEGTLFPGTFWIAFDEGPNWPVDDPGTPENERWDYILGHYFTYDNTPGAEGWDGKMVQTGELKPRWRFYTVAGDTVGGQCTSMWITIRDYDADGVVDENEYASKVISANIVAYINYSGGCFNVFCGQGSFDGDLDVINAEEWEEELNVSGRLALRDFGCNVDVETSSWGTIKAIYRD